MKEKYTIGYIDEDPNEVNTYARRLRPFGFNVVGFNFEKGMSFNELMTQVYDANEVDLLMIDFNLKGSNIVAFDGDKIESDFYDKKPRFPHIIFTSDTEYAEGFVEDLKIIFDKEDVFEDEETIQKFVTMLEKSILQYRNHIKKKKTLIAELLTKGENEGLDSSEQDSLISLQRELGDLDKTKKKEIPEKLISFEKLDDLSKTRKEAEAFLQSLIEKSKKK
ncbi:hypothetical protein [Polaribacter ponticola]|uniref:Response regulator n=1 Tax=Polaribacter ponticola TaxID=2978475 RepID=A0ABT5S5E7_9FLAO|nr:hypothetical protein [Polaribacter sp. MSW5]MDD7913333.1 hypothetical protein [Polaribacter sp. MSW5]